jgi:uncharacterized protein
MIVRYTTMLRVVVAISVLTVSVPFARPQQPSVATPTYPDMGTMLRPYFDDAFTPESGPDTDKAFIREYAGRIRQALPQRLSVQPSKRRRVLVITQHTMGYLHVPAAAGLLHLLRASAEKHKAFELTELTGDSQVTREMLSGFDAVILNNQSTPGDVRVHRELIPEYVRNGGGFFAVHAAALIDSLGDTGSEYNRMLGAYVDRSVKYGHPGNHYAVFPTILPNPEHPLVKGFRAQKKPYDLVYQQLMGPMGPRRKYEIKLTSPGQLSDELYVLLRAQGSDNRPTVLVEIDAPKSEVQYPGPPNEYSYAIAWIKRYGKGRVFYTQLGHNMAVYSIDAVAQMLLDGLQYVMGDLTVETK